MLGAVGMEVQEELSIGELRSQPVSGVEGERRLAHSRHAVDRTDHHRTRRVGGLRDGAQHMVELVLTAGERSHVAGKGPRRHRGGPRSRSQLDEGVEHPELELRRRVDPGDGQSRLVQQPPAEGLLPGGALCWLAGWRRRQGVVPDEEDQPRQPQPGCGLKLQLGVGQLRPTAYRGAESKSDDPHVHLRLGDLGAAVVSRLRISCGEIGHVGQCRQAGPVFLTDRRAPARTPALDVCPVTGRARLSYRRAAELFTDASRALGPSGAG